MAPSAHDQAAAPRSARPRWPTSTSPPGPTGRTRPRPGRRGRSGGRSPGRPPTAIRPAEAPSENSRSRRAGTWKECTTCTDTKRSVSGFSTVVMSARRRAHRVEEPAQRRYRRHRHHDLDPAGRPSPGPVGEHHPGETSATPPPTRSRPTSRAATAHASDGDDDGAPGRRHASRDGVLGHAGSVGPADRLDQAHGGRCAIAASAPDGPRQAAAGVPPVRHRARSRRPTARVSGETTEAPRSSSCDDRAQGAFRRPLGLVGVGRKVDDHGDRLGPRVARAP